MTLKDHLDLINGSVVLEITDDTGVLYRGYKGCFEYKETAPEMSDREVTSFCIRVEARRRKTDEPLTVINELNSGKFNYCDLFIELVYSYMIAK